MVSAHRQVTKSKTNRGIKAVRRIHRPTGCCHHLWSFLGGDGSAKRSSARRSKDLVQTCACRPGWSGKLAPGQKFVIDTVKMSVALPESDQQDRLRVISTAADVVSPIDKKMAKNFWSEGAQIETVTWCGWVKRPAISMMSSGQVDCAAALSFVENVPDGAVLQAEQSLIVARLPSCPKQTLDAVSRKLDAGLEKERGCLTRSNGRHVSSWRNVSMVTATFHKNVWNHAQSQGKCPRSRKPCCDVRANGAFRGQGRGHQGWLAASNVAGQG